MTTLAICGARDRFALGLALAEDPDQDSPAALRASWAKIQIWVGGRNLTAGIAASGAYRTEAECPALPVVKWLIDNWDALLHEERLPLPSHASSSAAWHVTSLKEALARGDDLDAVLVARMAWWRRHGLGAALPGFRIPDVHLRRSAAYVEISWDDREWKTVPGGISLVEAPGAAYIPVEEVATVLVSWCSEALERILEVLSRWSHESAVDDIGAQRQIIHALQAQLADLDSSERQQRRLLLAAGVDVERAARRIRSLAGLKSPDIEPTVRSLLGMQGESEGGLFARLTLPVLLYRSMSPDLSEIDLENLLNLCRIAEQAVAPLEEVRAPTPPAASPEETTQDGCEFAMEIRDDLGIPADAPLTGELDLERRLLPRLGVKVVDVQLTDESVEGAAIFRAGFQPIVAVNRSGRFARSRWGRRMTLAHELCHLLRDGERAGVSGIVSSRWAPYLVERRANAFAVMLLAPEPALAAILDRHADRWTRSDLKAAMAHLGIGVTTLTRQLCNLGWISESEREALVDELTEA